MNKFGSVCGKFLDHIRTAYKESGGFINMIAIMAWQISWLVVLQAIGLITRSWAWLTR